MLVNVQTNWNYQTWQVGVWNGTITLQSGLVISYQDNCKLTVWPRISLSNHTKICLEVFVATLFKVPQIWKIPNYLSTDEQQAVVNPYNEIPLTVKKNWTIDTDNNLHGSPRPFDSETIQSQKATFWINPFTWRPSKGKLWWRRGPAVGWTPGCGGCGTTRGSGEGDDRTALYLGTVAVTQSYTRVEIHRSVHQKKEESFLHMIILKNKITKVVWGLLFKDGGCVEFLPYSLPLKPAKNNNGTKHKEISKIKATGKLLQAPFSTRSTAPNLCRRCTEHQRVQRSNTCIPRPLTCIRFLQIQETDPRGPD